MLFWGQSRQLLPIPLTHSVGAAALRCIRAKGACFWRIPSPLARESQGEPDLKLPLCSQSNRYVLRIHKKSESGKSCCRLSLGTLAGNDHQGVANPAAKAGHA